MQTMTMTPLLNALAPVPPPFSWAAFVTMLTALGLSALMYMMLVRRWTSHRQWVSLARWCRETGFWMRPLRRTAVPAPLAELLRADEQVRFHLADDRTTLVHLQTDPPQPDAPPPQWNLLVRQRPAAGIVAALRPVSAKQSLIDLLPLSKYPSLMLGDRFVVYATESAGATALADSPIPSLLPQDLGFILLGDHVVVDFTSRPFDPIEFGRIIRLADQLAEVVV